MVTTMGIVAKRLNVDLVGTTVRVEKEMVADPLRRIGKLTVEIRGPGHVSGEHRRQLEAAAHTCPVFKSLHPNVQIPTTITWGE